MTTASGSGSGRHLAATMALAACQPEVMGFAIICEESFSLCTCNTAVPALSIRIGKRDKEIGGTQCSDGLSKMASCLDVLSVVQVWRDHQSGRSILRHVPGDPASYSQRSETRQLVAERLWQRTELRTIQAFRKPAGGSVWPSGGRCPVWRQPAVHQIDDRTIGNGPRLHRAFQEPSLISIAAGTGDVFGACRRIARVAAALDAAE